MAPGSSKPSVFGIRSESFLTPPPLQYKNIPVIVINWKEYLWSMEKYRLELCLIISWQVDGETMETVTDFIFLGSKITTDGHCSHEIKRGLLLGRKAMTNLDSILKSRGITLPTKVHLVKAMAFPLVMYVRVGLLRKLSAKELMLLNCGVGEDSWESLGLQGDPTSPS